jgi:hypothetical protein
MPVLPGTLIVSPPSYLLYLAPFRYFNLSPPIHSHINHLYNMGAVTLSFIPTEGNTSHYALTLSPPTFPMTAVQQPAPKILRAYRRRS